MVVLPGVFWTALPTPSSARFGNIREKADFCHTPYWGGHLNHDCTLEPPGWGALYKILMPTPCPQKFLFS